jgi:hypothetical protein
MASRSGYALELALAYGSPSAMVRPLASVTVKPSGSASAKP